MSRKAKKQRRPTQREFPVLIGVPVPTIDHKINSSLNIFISGCTYRRIAIPCTEKSGSAAVSRNQIIHNFLNKPEYQGMTHLLFMDADTCPGDPYAIEKMLCHQKDVVAGVTPMILPNDQNELELSWNIVRKWGEGNLPINKMPTKPFTVDRVGGTTILVHRRVLEKLKPPYQKFMYDEDHLKFKQSEDYYFCEKILDAGFNIWVDPHIVCHHWHMMDMMKVIQMILRMVDDNHKDN